MDKELNKKEKLVKSYFKKWMRSLGLLWWSITIHYYDDPDSILEIFKSQDEGRVIFARTMVDWKYAQATIQVNLLAMKTMDGDEIERAVVHELCHILVNEMREDEIHHEERVVTGLQKAFMWVAGE